MGFLDKFFNRNKVAPVQEIKDDKISMEDAETITAGTESREDWLKGQIGKWENEKATGKLSPDQMYQADCFIEKYIEELEEIERMKKVKRP